MPTMVIKFDPMKFILNLGYASAKNLYVQLNVLETICIKKPPVLRNHLL